MPKLIREEESRSYVILIALSNQVLGLHPITSNPGLYTKSEADRIASANRRASTYAAVMSVKDALKDPPSEEVRDALLKLM